ncbi:hypothetical protein, partial [Limnofasciculus baicalensis]
HFNGLELLAVELILRRVFSLTNNGARSELKLTGMRILVHFNGLELLAVELILRRVFWLTERD